MKTNKKQQLSEFLFLAVLFLENWKRTRADLAHRWDCTDFQEEEETIRPKYAALAPSSERNPITGVIEPHCQ